MLLLAGEAGSGKTRFVGELACHPLLARQTVQIRVIEDVQRPDVLGSEAMAYLAGVEQPSLIVTYRPEEMAPQRLAALVNEVRAPVTVVELVLEPLESVEVAEFAAARLGFPVLAEVVDVLLAQTGGVPRALEEALDVLPGSAAPLTARAVEQALACAPVPPVTRYGVHTRLSRLSPDALSVAELVAAADAPMPEDLLAAVCGWDAERLCQALADGISGSVLFESSSGYRLRHAMAGRVVHESVPGPRRRRLHALLAEALEAAGDPMPHERIAGHYRQAAKFDSWRRHAELGAEQAAAAGEVLRAVRLLRDVLAWPGLERADLSRLALRFGATAEYASGHQRAVEILRGLVDDPSLPAPIRGELRLNLGLLLVNQGADAEAGEPEIIRAIPDLAHRPELRARAMSALAVPGCSGRPLHDNLAWLSRTEEIADQVTDPTMWTAVQVNIIGTLLAIGDPRGWRRAKLLFTSPNTTGEQLQLRRGCLNVSDSATWLGRHRQARRFIQRARELGDSSHGAYVDVGIETMELILDWMTGQWSGLDRRAEAVARRRDLPRMAMEASFVAGALGLARTGSEGSARLLEDLAGKRPKEASPPVIAASAGMLTRWRLARGDVGAAIRIAEQGLGLVRAKEIWVWGSELTPAAVDAFAKAGRLTEAEDLVKEFGESTRDRDAPAAHAAMALCEAVLAEGHKELESAASSFYRARLRFVQLSRTYEAWRALESVGRCRLLAGVDGSGEVASALAGFEQLGAEFDAARCRSLLRQHGVEPPRRGRKRGYGQLLSPREDEVIRLASAGKTNTEIAAALFLSPRTIEQHVARALRKLGLRSRRELLGRSNT